MMAHSEFFTELPSTVLSGDARQRGYVQWRSGTNHHMWTSTHHCLFSNKPKPLLQLLQLYHHQPHLHLHPLCHHLETSHPHQEYLQQAHSLIHSYTHSTIMCSVDGLWLSLSFNSSLIGSLANTIRQLGDLSTNLLGLWHSVSARLKACVCD